MPEITSSERQQKPLRILRSAFVRYGREAERREEAIQLVEAVVPAGVERVMVTDQRPNFTTPGDFKDGFYGVQWLQEASDA